MTAASPIVLTGLGPGDADAVARLFGDVYPRAEPLTVAMGESAAYCAGWVRGVLPAAVDAGLSLVARRADTGEPVGALIAEDGAVPNASSVDAAGDDPIHALLSGLDAEYRAGRAVAPGEWLHLFLLVVADAAAGQGLAKRLISACTDAAARRGWRHAYTEATHPGSQRAFARLGFRTRLRRDYASWRFGGATPFARVAAHGGVLLMDRPLGAGTTNGPGGPGYDPPSSS